MRWLLVGLGALSFLSAAKTHGRQIRLERELAGYWEVTFGASNPAWVESLWRRDRMIYWSVAAFLLLCTIAFRAIAPRFDWPLPFGGPSGERSFRDEILFLVLVPLIGAFVTAGLSSVVRFTLAVRGGSAIGAGRSDDWWNGAGWGSAGWWALTLGLCTTLLLLGWRTTRP